jgi:hypothetical protein
MHPKNFAPHGPPGLEPPNTQPVTGRDTENDDPVTSKQVYPAGCHFIESLTNKRISINFGIESVK